MIALFAALAGAGTARGDTVENEIAQLKKIIAYQQAQIDELKRNGGGGGGLRPAQLEDIRHDINWLWRNTSAGTVLVCRLCKGMDAGTGTGTGSGTGAGSGSTTGGQ